MPSGQGLNLVGQIVKSLGGTVRLRSNQGRGTTVKVSVPLRKALSSSSVSSRDASRERSSLPASVGFFGFGDALATSAKGSDHAKGNMRLLNSMKRYCTQLGISLHATDDNMNSAAATHVVSEQALQALLEAKDEKLRQSLFSTENLRKSMIVICATRESASELRSGPLGRSLPGATQYLWLPIGPIKLSGALSMRRMYCPNVSWPVNETDNLAEEMLAENQPNEAVVGASTETIPETVEAKVEETQDEHEREGGAPARPSRSAVVVPRTQDQDKVIVNPGSTAGEKTQLPQRYRQSRSGSEAQDQSINDSLPLRTQMHRANTAPSSASKHPVSLLLVDDNVSNPPGKTSIKQTPTDHTPSAPGHQSPPSRSIRKESRTSIPHCAEWPPGRGIVRTLRGPGARRHGQHRPRPRPHLRLQHQLLEASSRRRQARRHPYGRQHARNGRLRGDARHPPLRAGRRLLARHHRRRHRPGRRLGPGRGLCQRHGPVPYETC